jgi:Tfp pilus assembly protein PilF
MQRNALVIWMTVLTLAVAGVLPSCATSGSEKGDSVRDADWHYKMASGYFENHQIYPAIRSLNKALEMDPDMAQAHFLLGFIYSGRREYTKAIQHYKSALEIKPNYFTAKNNLGSVYLSMERWEDAQEIFQSLVEEPMYPTPEMAHNNVGWALYNQREYEKALEHFKMAVFLKPQMCLAYNNIGMTHEEMGNISKAIDHFEKALKKCPNNYAEPHFRLGKIKQNRGNYAEAQRHFERCSEMLPDANLGERCRQYLKVR